MNGVAGWPAACSAGRAFEIAQGRLGGNPERTAEARIAIDSARLLN